MKRILGVVFLVFILVGSFVMLSNQHRTLTTIVVVENADIGIPGITKMYEARLRNGGLYPALVTCCDYVDDTLSHGQRLAYTVQHWENGRWASLWEVRPEDFCKPYPLGIVSGKTKLSLLWPSRELTTEQEATGARLRKGERARFVIFPRTPGDYQTALYTEPFEIDEQMSQPEVQFRVAH